MKKLIMIAFAATFSAVANAATVNWSMNSISASPDNSAKNTYMAYIFDTAVGYDSVISALAEGNTTVLDSQQCGANLLQHLILCSLWSYLAVQAVSAFYDE